MNDTKLNKRKGVSLDINCLCGANTELHRQLSKTNYVDLESTAPLFPGFYNSHIEFDEGNMEWTLFNNPDEIDKELKEYILDNYSAFTDYTMYQDDISKIWFDTIMQKIKETKDFGLCHLIKKAEFKELDIPREFNFNTDRAFGVYTVDFNGLLKVFINHDNTAKYLKDNFTSYDGFWSHTPNNVSCWTEWAYKNAELSIGVMVEFLLGESQEVNENSNLTDDITNATMEAFSSNNSTSEYIDYKAFAKNINESDELKLTEELDGFWSNIESIESFQGGNTFDQLITGNGFLVIDPDEQHISEFIDDSGLYKTTANKVTINNTIQR